MFHVARGLCPLTSRRRKYGFGHYDQNHTSRPDPCGIKNTNLDINIQNTYGNTGFYLACYYDCLAIFEYCIKDACLNLNIQNNYGWTTFHLACYYGNTSLISLFLNSNRKINLNIKSTKNFNGYPVQLLMIF